MDVRGKLVEQAISHFWYGISHDIFSEPVTTYAKLAIEALEKEKESGVTVQEWIPVSDRLPEANGVVLGYMLAGDFRTLKWKENTQRWEGLLLDYAKECVTHWMPLPQPPKGE